MGCDIHTHIEIRNRGSKNNFIKADIQTTYLHRHYGIFTALAGVRAYNYESITQLKPKGFPADASYQAFHSFHMSIAPDETYNLLEGTDFMKENVASESQAADWCRDGLSTEVVRNGTKYITHPDWHTPSWVDADELEQCLRAACGGIKDTGLYYQTLRIMRFYEKHGYDCRMVFWFDN